MSNTLNKPKRSGFHKVRAQQLKPPGAPVYDESGGENHQFKIRYVSDGTEIEAPATAALWRKIEGPEPRPDRPDPRLDMKIGQRYIILHEKDGEKKAVGLDTIPDHDLRGNMIPEDLKDIHNINLKIDQQDGSITVQSLPPRLSNGILMAIMNAIDLVDAIQPGDRLAGKYPVTMVSGNVIEVDPGV